jgi:hypothetical protein
MTPREYFIGAALQGLLAGRNPAAAPYTTAEIAAIAVECADYVILAIVKTDEKTNVTNPAK